MKVTSDWENYNISCYWTKIASANHSPRTRCKHATCLHGNHVYLFGGKDASKPLKDFWKFDIKSKEWEELDTRGCMLGHLQGHSLVSYKRLVLIFGGEFNNSINSAPLWIYNPDLNHIRKCVSEGSQASGRREHTAVIHHNKMYIYGGFDDIKGSISELWQYSIDEEEWLLLPQCKGEQPGGRHGHSAVVHNNCMWLFGGMSDLTVKNELWQYNFVLYKWSLYKVPYGPPALSGHTSAVVGSNLLIFGGQKQGQIVNDIWSFHFDSATWSKLDQDNRTTLPPLTQHSIVVKNGSRSDNTDQNVRTASVPQLQRKRQVRASQHSLPERPKTSPAASSQNNSQSTSVNFSNKVYPTSEDELSDFELKPVSASLKGDNSYCDIVQIPKLDRRPLLNDSLSNVSVGVDNCAQDFLMDEIKTNSAANVKENPTNRRNHWKQNEELNFYDLCSKCKLNQTYSKPSSTASSMYRSHCIVCSRPLRGSRHESDITIEDLEQLNTDIQKHESLMSNSFKDMSQSSACVTTFRDDIELSHFSSGQCASGGNCDVITMCSRCHSSHVCSSSDEDSSLITPTVVSIATQTDMEDKKRLYTPNEKKYMYQPQLSDENNSSRVNKVEIMIFGGKSDCRKSIETSPLSVWKLDIPF